MQKLIAGDVSEYFGTINDYLRPVDMRHLEQLLPLLNTKNEVNVSLAIDALFPGASHDNATAYLRQFIGRINTEANHQGIPFRIATSRSRKAGSANRFLWFEGENLLASHLAEYSDNATSELRHHNSLIANQGKPINNKPLVRWFVSYAHDDKGLSAELLELLKVRFKNSKFYRHDIWTDQDLIVGRDASGNGWYQQIQDRLQQCNAGLLLVSHSFLASEFITREELPLFLQQKSHLSVPVALKKINFSNTDLKGLERQQLFLDSDKKAFNQRRGNKKEEWVDQLITDIEQKLSQLISAYPDALETSSNHKRKGEYLQGCFMGLHDSDEIRAFRVRNFGQKVGLEKFEKTEKADTTETDKPQEDALDYMLDWVTDIQSQPLFALLGEYGMGKTICCQRLVRALKEADTDISPVYLDLRNLSNVGNSVPTLETTITDCINRGWSAAEQTISYRDIYTLWEKGKALLIFDGLDEVLVHFSESDGLRFTQGLTQWIREKTAPDNHSKILISCRTHYFKTLREQKNHFTGQERSPSLEADQYCGFLLLPFSEDQVADYLRQALPETDTDNLIQLIQSVHNLDELTRRPYTLKLVAQFIPRIEAWRMQGKPVYGVTLYREVVQSWLERDVGKHHIKTVHKLQLTAHLAATLWKKQSRVMPVTALENWLHEWLDQDSALERRYRHVDKDKLEEDLRTATFLVRLDASKESQSGFRFAHSSLLEFFLASYLYQAARDNRPESWDMPMPGRETLIFLGQMLAEDNSPIQTMNQWRTTSLPATNLLMFRYTLLVKQQYPAPSLSQMNLQGADLGDLTLSGDPDQPLDLSNIRFDQANLHNAVFEHCILNGAVFEGSRLNGAIFEHCQLRQANFSYSSVAGTSYRHCELDQSQWDHVETDQISLLHSPLIHPQLQHGYQLPEKIIAPPHNAKLGFLKHFDLVNCVAFSPDGTQLLSASDDKTLKLWDANSATCLQTFEGHSASVTSCAFSPDGTRLLSASGDKTLKLWNANSATCLQTFEGHSASVTSCAFSPDGTRLLSASGDKTLKLWDANSATCLQTFEGHSDWVTSCAFSPDGTRLLSASGDKTLKLWDANSATCLQTFEGHSGWVTSFAFSPDGTRLLSASWDNTLKLWDANSATCLQTFEGHSGWVTSCAFSPDGTRLLSASGDNTLKLWDANSATCLQTFEGHSGRVTSCAFSPDGTRLLSASWDKTLKLWDANSATCLQTFEGHSGWVTSCAFSPDGTRLLSASGDNTLKLWDANSATCLQTFEGHSGWVTSCAFSPDGTRLLSASWDKTLKLWDANSATCLQTFEGHSDWVTSCAFSPDGTRLLSASHDKTLKLWDANSATCLQTFEGHSDWVTSCAFSPDGTRLLSASHDKTLKLWDANSATCLQTFEGHSDWVTSCAFSPDGTRLLSASHDKTLKLWDANSATCLQTFEGHSDWVTSCAFSPDGTRLLSASHDKTLKLWDANSATCLQTFEGHSGRVTSCAFSPDGLLLLSASNDATIRLWHRHSATTALVIYIREGHAAWRPGSSDRLLHWSGHAWRTLGWRLCDDQGNYPTSSALPLEHYACQPVT